MDTDCGKILILVSSGISLKFMMMLHGTNEVMNYFADEIYCSLSLF